MRNRREFSKDVRRDAYERSKIAGVARCEVGRVEAMPDVGCGLEVYAGNIFYEHIICDGIDGAPTLENCAVLCKICWRIKTDFYDRPIVAKAKRQHDRAIGIPKEHSRPIAGSKRSGIKLSMNSAPRWRDSGLPLHERRSS